MQLHGNSTDAEAARCHCFWELDARLRYRHYSPGIAQTSTSEIANCIGQKYLKRLENEIPAAAPARTLGQLLDAHRPIDMTICMDKVDSDKNYRHIVAKPQWDSHGKFAGYLGCEVDMPSGQILQNQLVWQAHHDDLTGAFNRRGFNKRLHQLRDFVQGTAHEFALCFIDLDRFKIVNDTAGHAAGDLLLQQLVELINSELYEGETLGRMGGDEFALLLEATVDEAELRMIDLIDLLSDHVLDWQSRRFQVGASVGVTGVKHGEDTVAQLLDRADSACFTAKENGRNRCVVFSGNSPAYLKYRADLERVEVIREALDANRLCLFMQAIRSVSGNDARLHFETLLRLKSDQGELMSPYTFIPVAEKYLMMQDLDQWVVRHCIELLGTLHKDSPPLDLSINLSGNTLSDQSALEAIAELVGRSAYASQLWFEVPESAAISNLDNVTEFMTRLRREGVRFALDHFGAGLSSFAYIQSLPIDALKIDGFFIRNIRHNKTNQVIAESFVQLASRLGFNTVAESVEDKATLKFVADIGVDSVQGYGVCRPEPEATVLEQYLL